MMRFSTCVPHQTIFLLKHISIVKTYVLVCDKKKSNQVEKKKYYEN